MTPLGMVVVGLGLVVADFRFNGFDLIPDLIGWGVVFAGLANLVGRSPWFTAAAVASVFGVILGLPLQFAESGPVLRSVESVVLAVVVFGTCTGIRAVVASERTRDTADLIRWPYLALTLAPVVLYAAVPGLPTEVTGGPAAVAIVLVAVAWFAYLVWFLVLLWTNQADPALGARGSTRQPDPV